ncbi:MAG: hypothetical protein AB9866_03555 [Syntrophobacteraceae bacterium]
MSRFRTTFAAFRRDIGIMIILAIAFSGLLSPELRAHAAVAHSSTHGAPNFATDKATGDDRWVGGFGVGGMDSFVFALATDGSGNLYATGAFGKAGSVEAHAIAKWNGSEWSPFGAGLDGWTGAIAVDGNGNIYVGGAFSTAGGMPANYIAKWNGSEWSVLGSGTDGSVSVIAADVNGNIYVGGEFSTAGGVAANHIAMWNGTEWFPVGSGMNGCVQAIAIDKIGNLYAGGRFSVAGGVAVNNIAMWNGNAWSAVGAGVGCIDCNPYSDPDHVLALATDGSGNLYAGGSFNWAGNVQAFGIAKWDGVEWASVGGGVDSPVPEEWSYSTYGTVYAIATDVDGNVYAGGNFQWAGGVWVNHMAMWNGSEWSALGYGVYRKERCWYPDSSMPDYECNGARVHAISVAGNGIVYAGGNFIESSGSVTNNIAKWTGSQWSALRSESDQGINGGVVKALIADSSSNLFAGGSFTLAGGVLADHIARWNGGGWSPLGSGANGDVNALALDGKGYLYAGGSFTTAGGEPVSNIAKWNGSTWSAVGNGLPGPVHALAIDIGTGRIYAGGDFILTGNAAAKGIACWNGDHWEALGAGIEGQSVKVKALAVDGSGNLYAAGEFSLAGGVPVNNIAKWNGIEWSSLGTGITGSAAALAIDKCGNLYVAYNYIDTWTTYYDLPIGEIAKWNGSEWSIVHGGESFKSLAVNGNGNLYAGGDSVWNGTLKQWDGHAWSALGGGVDSSDVFALASDESGNLYAGGAFTAAGGKPSSHIAKWQGRPAIAVDFLSKGLYLWSSYWQGKISSSHPALLGGWGDRLVASFPMGLYFHEGTIWKRISTNNTAKSFVGVGDSLFVGFKTGTYRYTNGLSKIRNFSPIQMASYGEKLVVNYPDGIWEYDGSAWKRISTWTTAEQMVGIERRLFVDFGAKGVYRINVGGSWVQTTVFNPKKMHVFGKALVASFNSSTVRGLYIYQGNSWKKISSVSSAEGFASTPLTLYVDRGVKGIYKYEKGNWKQISTLNPDRIAMYGGKLVAHFPSKGLRSYGASGWSNMSFDLDAGLMNGVIFK